MTGYKRIEPAFRDERKCIVFCTDSGYVPGTAVALRSIADHARADRNYDMIVLHSRVGKELQEKVIHMFDGESNISVRFFDVSGVVAGTDFYTGNRSTLTGEAYYRLYIPWVLDNAYEKALYLDGDMLVLKDIGELLDTDTGDALIAAVRDYWGICNCYMPGDPMRGYREKIGIKSMDEFVISATILFNLKKFREEYELAHVTRLIGSFEWRQHDQDVLNILCQGRTTLLSPKWGYVSRYGNEVFLPQYLQKHLEEAEGDIRIAHFAGGDRKPWMKRGIDHPEDITFWMTVERTPFLNELLDKAKYPYYKSIVLKVLSELKAKDGRNADAKKDRYDCFAELFTMRIYGGRLHLSGSIMDLNMGDEKDGCALLFLNDEQGGSSALKSERGGYIECIAFHEYSRNNFCFDVPLDPQKKSYSVKIGLKRGDRVMPCVLVNSSSFPIYEVYANSYVYGDGWIATFEKERLMLCQSGKRGRIKKEIAYIKEIYKNGGRAACLLRLAYPLLRVLYRRPVWLVSDRLTSADDNGMAFFRYLNDKHKKDVNSYFIIKKDCDSYKTVKKTGKVLEPGSLRHRLMAVIADAHIMSQTDMIFRWVFDMEKTPLCDRLGRASHIFLQHGILISDASLWLAKSRYAFDGFISGSPSEYDSILNGDYGYTDKELWLTGPARYDYLEDRRKKVITVMPTWRKYLTKQQNPVTGDWYVADDFEKSAYADFFRRLMTDDRLNKKAAELGYEIRFKVHPSFKNCVSRFGFPPEVKVVDDSISYRDIYAESALCVTDYSSSILDMVYLGKPVIYCMFDKDEFGSGRHITRKGDFDYERDGFGEVEYDLEHTVDRISEYMENGCKLKEKYRERIDRFFTFSDRNNCSRIYDRIMTEVRAKRH